MANQLSQVVRSAMLQSVEDISYLRNPFESKKEEYDIIRLMGDAGTDYSSPRLRGCMAA